MKKKTIFGYKNFYHKLLRDYLHILLLPLIFLKKFSFIVFFLFQDANGLASAAADEDKENNNNAEDNAAPAGAGEEAAKVNGMPPTPVQNS